jgi:hypothetical protein
MSSLAWKLTETVAQWLEPHEREPVLGDLQEAGLVSWQGLLEVIGLFARRQLALWSSWRPWLAGPGLALPHSFLLIGNSLAVCMALTQLHSSSGKNQAEILSHAFFLILWAWSGGYAVGALSRKTLWVSTAMCFLPCLFCFSRFHSDSPLRFGLLLFVLPALLGVRQSLTGFGIRKLYAFALAAAATCWMLAWYSKGEMWAGNWLLIWPLWLVATNMRSVRTEAQ